MEDATAVDNIKTHPWDDEQHLSIARAFGFHSYDALMAATECVGILGDEGYFITKMNDQFMAWNDRDPAKACLFGSRSEARAHLREQHTTRKWELIAAGHEFVTLRC